MDKGDIVKIVPSDTHMPFVKRFYGKELEIDRKIGDSIYRVKGVPLAATEKDLEFIRSVQG